MSKQVNPHTGKIETRNPIKGWQKEKRRREIQKVVKQMRPNRDADRPRRRDWQDSEDDDYVGFERVMPRGEHERRRAAQRTVLSREVGYDRQPALEAEDSTGPNRLQGVVTQVSSSLCRVDVHGRVLLCALRGGLSAQASGYTNVITVGDHVIISDSGAGQGVVEAVLPRRSTLSRPDVFSSHLQQAIAANVDQLLVVASWREPHIWLELIDRYLITAARNNLLPIICVNKIDLAEDHAACMQMLQPYRDLGYRLLFTSARTGQGIDELRQVLHDQTTVLAGLSGVGKSSLLAAVQPGLNLRTNEVSEASRQGQHTTTQATMLRLDIDGYVVDTPGIREFGLSGLVRNELVQFYPDLNAFADGCRYTNCTHVNEPDCAVKAAVEQGVLAEWRYHNYAKIYGELGTA